jgi:hypothetical protein
MKQMSKLGMVSATVIAGWLGAWASPALAEDAVVAATGQTECYDIPGKVINCAGTGQDGDVQAGVPTPSPRFVDLRNGTIKDTLTGLTWLKNADCFGPVRWDYALAYSKTLATGQCGLGDGSKPRNWHMPNIKELQSLIDFGFVSPALSNAAGNAQWTQGDPFLKIGSSPWGYWSSTAALEAPWDALVMEMGGGRLFGLHKTNTSLFWAVKGDAK